MALLTMCMKMHKEVTNLPFWIPKDRAANTESISKQITC